jgi:hypothetical protein
MGTVLASVGTQSSAGAASVRVTELSTAPIQLNQSLRLPQLPLPQLAVSLGERTRLLSDLCLVRLLLLRLDLQPLLSLVLLPLLCLDLRFLLGLNLGCLLRRALLPGR